MNNIYDMYIVLCEYWFPCYFLFKLTHKKAEKPKTRKSSGHGGVTSIYKAKGVLIQVKDEIKPKF